MGFKARKRMSGALHTEPNDYLLFRASDWQRIRDKLDQSVPADDPIRDTMAWPINFYGDEIPEPNEHWEWTLSRRPKLS